ncbi:NU5M oxidoreductase, partial [Acromyrmex heyeri]
LPIAIAVPTSVALVHSSTLVTAGVYLIICFNKFLIRTNVRIILRFLSIITIFTSGMIANINFEFRFRLTVYYHLLVHAIFKSILAAGAVIHSMKNTQDIRLLENLNEVIPYVIIRLLINNFSNIALRGVPFISGFYRKDIIIENHNFDWSNVKILDKKPSYKKRLTSEMVHIKKQSQGLNKQSESDSLHESYLSIKSFFLS